MTEIDGHSSHDSFSDSQFIRFIDRNLSVTIDKGNTFAQRIVVSVAVFVHAHKQKDSVIGITGDLLTKISQFSFIRIDDCEWHFRKVFLTVQKLMRITNSRNTSITDADYFLGFGIDLLCQFYSVVDRRIFDDSGYIGIAYSGLG